MTSGNLFFKLLREDLKRRTWAIALCMLTFFFSMPISLALAMENQIHSHFFRYNNYIPLLNDGTLPEQEYLTRLLGLKTNVVIEQVRFGNGLMVFLMITAAVVMGVTGFAYLHNKKQVDFYHSIPVRRELLFGVQFVDGILIAAAAYLINSILLAAVASAYGVHLSSFAGVMARGYGLNLLYYGLMYATTVIAVMMTGNMVVGLLATGILFFFLPGMCMILSAYADTFFTTMSRNFWNITDTLSEFGTKYLSPFTAYIWAAGKRGGIAGETVRGVITLPVLTAAALLLYRMRPSEAAGKAMAFKWSMAPIRWIMATGFGLSGGLFFWALQSQIRWGVFGLVAGVLLSHCVIEIIYHFDFKKLFSHKWQMVSCLVLAVLVFFSFRYDWYGYDSYLPEPDKVASVSLQIGADSDWLDSGGWIEEQDGREVLSYRQSYEWIEENMKLTDTADVLKMAEAGVEYAKTLRVKQFSQQDTDAYEEDSAGQEEVITQIGGADGPTSIFIAAKNGIKREYDTTVNVKYTLTSGRKVSRCYRINLLNVLDAYKNIYSQEAYKTGVYDILTKAPESIAYASYLEAGSVPLHTTDSAAVSALLDAYQADLLAQTIDQRLVESPIGSVQFTDRDIYSYLAKQQSADLLADRVRAMSAEYRYKESAASVISGAESDYFGGGGQAWPVYPSFTRTIEALKKQGIEVGSYFSPSQAEKIIVDISSFYRDASSGDAVLPEDMENPYYKGDGSLVFDTPQTMQALMQAMSESDRNNQNPLNPLWNSRIDARVIMKNGNEVSANLLNNKMTPEIETLFEGLPLE